MRRHSMRGRGQSPTCGVAQADAATLSASFWRDTHDMTCRIDFRSLHPSLLQLAIVHKHVSSSFRDTTSARLSTSIEMQNHAQWMGLGPPLQLDPASGVGLYAELKCQLVHLVPSPNAPATFPSIPDYVFNTATSMINRASSTIIILTGISQTQTPECQLPPNACR